MQIIFSLIEEIKQLFLEKKYSLSLPGVLYHYTSAKSLLGIIENATIYLSDIRGMNDYTEIYHGNNQIEKILNQAKGISEKNIWGKIKEGKSDDFSNLEQAISIFYCNRQTSEPFIFCTSAEKYLLSQWLNYACDGKGFAIGFDTSVLENMKIYKSHTHLNVAGSRTIISPVIYHEELQQKIVTLCLELMEINNYAQESDFHELAEKINELPVHMSIPSPILVNVDKNNEPKYDMCGEPFQQNKREMLFSNLLHLIKIFKHNGYAAEKEYRIMKIPNYLSIGMLGQEVEQEHKISFRCSGQNIIPQTSICFCNNKNILKEIISGPSNTNDPKHMGLLLQQYNFEHTMLNRCNIPYRNNKA